MKNPVLPFYNSDVKDNFYGDIEITYNTNSFYIFCKNFEVIVAEVFKFKELKTTADQASKVSELCNSIALNIFNAGYSLKEVVNYLKEEFNVEDTVEAKERTEEEIVEALAKELAKVTSKQLSNVLVKFSPLFGKCTTESIELIATYVNTALVELESSRFCNVFSVYEYLLNNYNIFTDVVNQIKNICSSFAGIEARYTEDGFIALDQLNKLCINTIRVDRDLKRGLERDLETQSTVFTYFGKESPLLYFSAGTPKCNTKRVSDFVKYLYKQPSFNWENWERMLMLAFKQDDLFRKVFNYNYVANFVLAGCREITDNNDFINKEALAKVKLLFSKEEEIIQLLMDNSNWENCCKELSTLSLNNVLEENFKHECDDAYNTFSKKAYSDLEIERGD